MSAEDVAKIINAEHLWDEGLMYELKQAIRKANFQATVANIEILDREAICFKGIMGCNNAYKVKITFLSEPRDITE